MLTNRRTAILCTMLLAPLLAAAATIKEWDLESADPIFELFEGAECAGNPSWSSKIPKDVAFGEAIDINPIVTKIGSIRFKAAYELVTYFPLLKPDLDINDIIDGGDTTKVKLVDPIVTEGHAMARLYPSRAMKYTKNGSTIEKTCFNLDQQEAEKYFNLKSTYAIYKAKCNYAPDAKWQQFWPWCPIPGLEPTRTGITTNRPGSTSPIII